MTELRHRVKRHTYPSFHETTCRKCARSYRTRGLSHICSTCWLKDHPRKKRRRA